MITDGATATAEQIGSSTRTNGKIERDQTRRCPRYTVGPY
jgi:hypothetical protein